MYRSLVRIGERVGSLESVFHRLSAYLSDKAVLKEKLISALSYPTLVLITALAGAALLAFFMLPRLETLFIEIGGQASQELRDRLSSAARLFQFVTVALCSSITICVALIIARKRGSALSLATDKILLSLPLVGILIREWETLNFAFAMEILAKGSVPLEAALREAAGTASNEAFRAAIIRAREDVLKGIPLATAIGSRAEIPSYVGRWAAIGEKTGQTEKVFTQIRTFFQLEIARKTMRLNAALEPTLILAVGAVVIFLIVSFVLPLFSLYGALL